MRVGTLGHMCLFEPNRFRAETAVAPIVDRRTREGKSIWEQFQAENAGKELITADEAEQLQAMRTAVRAHPAAAKLLDNGNPEVSMFAKDDDTDTRLGRIVAIVALAAAVAIRDIGGSMLALAIATAASLWPTLGRHWTRLSLAGVGLGSAALVAVAPQVGSAFAIVGFAALVVATPAFGPVLVLIAARYVGPDAALAASLVCAATAVTRLL